MRARRGFALLAAIGVLAVLGLIIAALGDSVMAHRQVAQRWKERTDERLALEWAVENLRTNVSSVVPLTVDGTWGTLPVRGSLVPLDPSSAAYDHPALSHHPGDSLAVIEIGDQVHRLLLRESPIPTHHRLPASLFAANEETVQ